MTVAESIGVFVGIPLAIFAVIVLLNLRGARRRPRYRPGQPWEYPPVWWEPHPEHAPAPDGHGAGHAGDGHVAVGAGTSRPALDSGSTAGTAHRGGPLGGARGTW